MIIFYGIFFYFFYHLAQLHIDYPEIPLRAKIYLSIYSCFSFILYC